MTVIPIDLSATVLPLLQHKQAKIICLIGGGGKTSLMYYLAAQLQRQGIPVLASTTTKLFLPDGKTVFLSSIREGRQYLEKGIFTEHPITIARDFLATDKRKITGLPPEWIDCFAGNFPDYVWIVEADGAAGRPLKGHRNDEPVLPATTGLVLAVVGIDALGRPLDERYVHRPGLIQAISGYHAEPLVTDTMIAALVTSPKGYRNHCPPEAQFLPVINKVETAAHMWQAERLAQEIMQNQASITTIVCGSAHKGQFFAIS